MKKHTSETILKRLNQIILEAGYAEEFPEFELKNEKIYLKEDELSFELLSKIITYRPNFELGIIQKINMYILNYLELKNIKTYLD